MTNEDFEKMQREIAVAIGRVSGEIRRVVNVALNDTREVLSSFDTPQPAPAPDGRVHCKECKFWGAWAGQRC